MKRFSEKEVGVSFDDAIRVLVDALEQLDAYPIGGQSRAQALIQAYRTSGIRGLLTIVYEEEKAKEKTPNERPS